VVPLALEFLEPSFPRQDGSLNELIKRGEQKVDQQATVSRRCDNGWVVIREGRSGRALEDKQSFLMYKL